VNRLRTVGEDCIPDPFQREPTVARQLKADEDHNDTEDRANIESRGEDVVIAMPPAVQTQTNDQSSSQTGEEYWTGPDELMSFSSQPELCQMA
jgi:hypothetical protein